MDADDPRHGTHGGYMAHYTDDEKPCLSCRRGHALAEKQRVLDQARNKPRRVSGLGTARRIQALIANGWTMPELARRLGFAAQNIQRLARAEDKQVRTATAERIDELFDALCLILPPERNRQERWSAAMARGMAQRNGWVSAFAWDDIDNDEAPIGKRRAGTEYDSADLVDEATVLRILSGEVLPANAAERREVMRRWLAAGNSERSLCDRMGWKDGRYVTREDAA